MKSYMVSQTDPRHPTDEVLLALVHEQSFDDAAAIRGHVVTCASCSARTRELAAHDAVIADLLGSLDHPLPEARAPFSARHSGLLRRAALVAGAVATMAGAAAALVPGSPVHEWIVARSAPQAPVRPAPIATSPEATTATATSRDAAMASGIAIPAQATLDVEFRREQESGTVELVRSVPADVTFRSRGGTTAYDVADGRVVIDNRTPAEVYVIDIPSAVQHVRIHVGTRTLIRWPDDSARYVLANDLHRARVALRP